MTRFLPVLFSALLAAGLANTAAARGDAAAGESKSASCAACHGADGNSDNPAFPRIAGQYEDYLYQALRQYKDGERNNAIMAGIVAPLSDTDLKDLAAFYARQDGDLRPTP